MSENLIKKEAYTDESGSQYREDWYEKHRELCLQNYDLNIQFFNLLDYADFDNAITLLILHFTVHLLFKICVYTIIGLTVIKHIFIKNLPVIFVKDLTGEQIVAKIKREQMIAKQKGVYDYGKTILWEHCYDYQYTFVRVKYRLYAMGIFKPGGNPKMGYDYPTLYPASWCAVVFCECP